MMSTKFLRSRLVGAVVLVSLATVGCSEFRVVPIQMTRSVLTESHVQCYDFQRSDDARRALLLILGDDNWKKIENDTWTRFIDLVQSNRLIVRGTTVFSLSLHPALSGHFFVEGWGRYLMSITHAGTPEDDLLIGSANYRILDDGPGRLEELIDQKSLSIRLEQYAIREYMPSRTRLVHRSNIAIRVYLERIEKDVFAIDYRKWHDIGIEESGSEKADEQPVGSPRISVRSAGCLHFETPPDGRKLADLREARSNFVQNDYKDILKRNGMIPSGKRPIIEWPVSTVCERQNNETNLPSREDDWKARLKGPLTQCPKWKNN